MKTHTTTTLRLLPVLLAVTLAGCGARTAEVAPAATPVLVMTVNGGSDVNATQRRLPGFIASRYQADMGFQVPGRIGERLVEIGASVKRGQPLLRLQSADYVQGLSAAEDQLQAARIDAQQTNTEASRFASLVKSGAVSEADQQGQQARADAARARLQLAERQATVARNRLAYTTLTAPFDGVVTSLRAEVGQVVGEGLPVVQIAQEETPEIMVDIPEDLVASVPRGQLSARLTGTHNVPLTVQLREIEPAASMPLRSYRARFSLVGKDRPTQQQMKLGMTAEVAIPVKTGQTHSDMVVLPAGAIISQGETASVWVLSSEGSTLLKKSVTVTQLIDQGVKVSGLQQGEKVVITGTEKLREGQSVRAIERTGTGYQSDTAHSDVRQTKQGAAR